MADPTAVISLTGDKLLAALENGVSKYPAMEGRFPCGKLLCVCHAIEPFCELSKGWLQQLTV